MTDGARRVGVLERQLPEADEQRGPARLSDGRGREQADLLDVLDVVAESVRAGRYATATMDGVLVDTVVGSSRYVLFVQEPTVAVRLSPREQEIARMVANGRTNSAIASALDISVWTVSTHLRRIFAKLAVCSRAEMVAHLGQGAPGTVDQMTAVLTQR